MEWSSIEKIIVICPVISSVAAAVGIYISYLNYQELLKTHRSDYANKIKLIRLEHFHKLIWESLFLHIEKYLVCLDSLQLMDESIWVNEDKTKEMMAKYSNASSNYIKNVVELINGIDEKLAEKLRTDIHNFQDEWCEKIASWGPESLEREEINRLILQHKTKMIRILFDYNGDD